MNDLIGSWESGGVREFIVLTAHGQDPHQEALSTVHARDARVHAVDIFAIPLDSKIFGDAGIPAHGGEMDTSLLLYVNGELVDLPRATDYTPSPGSVRRYLSGSRHAIPSDSPGSIGHPSQASTEKGKRLYHFIYERIANRVFRTSEVEV
jgi:creatinine amidohydrolase/Fe(II)-dependent formamide hydrolase-like protein